MADPLPTEITILTLNCWGLKYISSQRNERLLEIGKQLSLADHQTPDIVGLQECFCHNDFQAIRQQVRARLPYGKYYHSGSFGSGLAILSRWPIEQSTMIPYPLNGRPTAFWRGDWYVGKGIAHARICIGGDGGSSPSSPPSRRILEVFNTHTHPAYDDTYAVHCAAQAWELAKTIRGAVQRGSLVVALGDFNMVPASREYALVSALSGVRDSWRVLHPDSAGGPVDDRHDPEAGRRRPVPGATFNVEVNGATVDGPFNTWRWPKGRRRELGGGKMGTEVLGTEPDRKGKRIDFVFASTGSAETISDKSGEKAGWVVESAKVCMMQRHPVLGCSLSDHFGVETTLRWHSLPGDEEMKNETLDSHKSEDLMTKSNHHDHLGQQLSLASQHDDTSEALGPIYDGILDDIQEYMSRQHRQRRLRQTHFFVWFVATIGCYIAVWFSPRDFVAFILMLLSSLGLAAGVVDGLIGLLFVSAEIGRLKEFMWEIENARAACSTKT